MTRTDICCHCDSPRSSTRYADCSRPTHGRTGRCPHQLERWLASPDHKTHTVLPRCSARGQTRQQPTTRRPTISGFRPSCSPLLTASGHATVESGQWAHAVAALVRSLPSDEAIRDTLDRLVPTILIATRTVDGTRWVTTLWTLVTDSPRSDERRRMIAAAQHRMMHDPMEAAPMRAWPAGTSVSSTHHHRTGVGPPARNPHQEPHPRQRGARELAPRTAAGASHPVGG
jgi:hypothetical protein